jgi:hypothetical protein
VATPYTATAPPRSEGRLLLGLVGFSHPLHHTGLKTEQILTLKVLSEQKFLVKFASQNCLNYLSDPPLLALPPGSQPQCNLNQG